MSHPSHLQRTAVTTVLISQNDPHPFANLSFGRYLRAISICDFWYPQNITSRPKTALQPPSRKGSAPSIPFLVAELSHAYKDWKKLSDLPDQFMKELEAFFVNYHGLEGKKYKLLGCKEAKTALDLVKKSQKAASRAK